MKIKAILLIGLIAFTSIINAQCPLAMNYQTVVRDASGNPLANTTVAMRFTIDDSITPVYQETHTVTNGDALVTNQFGHLQALIGFGTPVFGSFANINWGSGHKYMQVEIDVNETGTYVNMGVMQLNSDPYALYADSAGKGGYPAHYIGEHYGGGVVFYVTDNGLHGLIADSADLQTGLLWDSTNTVTNAKLTGTGGGSSNTERIIISQGVGNYAAQVCANYTGGGYGDWYLPSVNELSLLYQQQHIIGGFSPSSYWSSTETAAATASAVNFSNGNAAATPKSTAGNVRAVRGF